MSPASLIPQSSPSLPGKCGVEVSGKMVKVVSVRDAVTGYGESRILDGLNLTVRQGEVYALLGPSGCGKTTLLSCILSRKKLDSGSISVFGGTPGDRSIGLPGALVGYMPQDICLYQEFTILETFQYFGKLQKMSKDNIETKQIALRDMLDLPEPNRRVSHLSGGQKRRLSFAVALLHNPRLLILDEPTVGVDPVVRARIWSHLQTLSFSGVSMIITTHYIEEAREAHTVGIMREGRLLAQNSPGALMENYQAATLEKVFLCLCQELENSDQGDTRLSSKTESLRSISVEQETELLVKAKLIKGNPKEKQIRAPTVPSLSNVAALIMKNWITMKRNLPLLLFVFFLPGIVLLISSLTVGLSPHDIPIALVNHESDCADSTYLTSCSAHLLSCYFSQALNVTQEVTLVHFKNKTEASLASKTADVRGIIEVPQNFSTSLLKRVLSKDMFDNFAYYYGVEDEDIIGIHEKMSVSVDNSDPQLSLFVMQAITKTLTDFTSNVNSACDSYLSEGVDLGIITMEPPTLGSEATDFREFVTPGIIALAIFFLAMALTSESFITERSQGLLERSWITGVLPTEILASYICSQFLVMLVQVAITLLTVFVLFQLPCQGPLGWIILLTLFQGLAGMSFGFFLSTICNNSMDAMKMSIGACFPHMLLCGIIWPLEGIQHTWLRGLTWIFPHTSAVQGMRDIMLRGWGVESSAVIFGIIIPTVWIIVFLGVSWRLVKIKMR